MDTYLLKYRLELILCIFFMFCFIVGMLEPKLVIGWGALKKRNKKRVFMYYGIGLIIMISLLINVHDQYADDYTSHEKYDSTSYSTEIDYPKVARDPSNYYLTKVKYIARIRKIIQSDDRTELIVLVDNDVNGILHIEFKSDTINQEFLENDVITVWGRVISPHTYKTVLGEDTYIPAMWADNIEPYGSYIPLQQKY